MPSDLIRGWTPVRRPKMRPHKEKRAKPDSIKTGFALELCRKHPIGGTMAVHEGLDIDDDLRAHVDAAFNRR
jgi:hypothetical protein